MHTFVQTLSESIYSCKKHDYRIILKGCIFSWVAGASEEAPVGPDEASFFNRKIHANSVSRRFRLSISLTQVLRSHSLALHHLQLLSNGLDYLCLCVSPTMPRNIFTSVSATTLLSFRLPNKGHITIRRYPAETFGQTLCYNISLYFTPTQFEI